MTQSKWNSLALIGLIGMGLILTSCSGGGGGSSGKSEVIGAAGGTLEVTSGSLEGAELFVPPGGVATDTKFTIRSGSNINQADTTRVGPAIRLTPEGFQFLNPAQVTVPIDNALVGGAHNALAVLKRNDDTGTITTIPPMDVDETNGLVTVETTGLSTFQAVLVEADDPDGEYNMVTLLSDLVENPNSEEGIIRIANATGDEYSFDGNGGASSTAGTEGDGELSVDAANDQGDVTSSSNSLNRGLSAIDLFASGFFVLDTADGEMNGALSASQEVLVVAFPDSDADSTAHDLAIGLETGSNMDDTDFSGDYHYFALGMDVGDNGGTNAVVNTIIFTGEYNADGSGFLTWTDFDEEAAILDFPFIANGALFDTDTSSDVPDNWTFDVNADGKLDVTDDDASDFEGALTPSGEVVVWTGRFVETEAVAVDFGISIEQGSGLDEDDLDGQYNLFGFGTDLGVANSNDNGVINLFLFENGTLNFDGAGDVDLTGLDETGGQLDVNGTAALVALNAVTDTDSSDSGTYTVDGDGAVTISIGGDTLVGAMSPSGDVIVATLSQSGSNDGARDIYIAVKRP